MSMNYHQSQQSQSRRHQQSYQNRQSRSNYNQSHNLSSSRNSPIPSPSSTARSPHSSRSAHHSHSNLHNASRIQTGRRMTSNSSNNKPQSSSSSTPTGTPLHSISSPHSHRHPPPSRPAPNPKSSPSPNITQKNSNSSSSNKPQQSKEQKEMDADTKYIIESTARITDLAGIPAQSDTAALIQRSVRQHVEYEKRLKHHQQHPQHHQEGKQQDDNNNMRKIMDYIQQLTELENRESALNKLSKLRENNPDLAPLLWGTPAVIAALIQEVISVYPYLSGNIEMNSSHSNRCCNALALLQCVASHPETRGLFLKAYIPLFLYPFLNTELNSRPFEYLRLTSLGVIGALVKHPHPNVVPNSFTRIVPDSEVTEFLVKTEAIPLCLHIMEFGNELSQTVATFIIQKILLDDYGLNYICKTGDRFQAISQVLNKMILDPMKKPSKKLIKHVIRCYLRLCDDNRVYLSLHGVLPKYLVSGECEKLIRDDSNCLIWIKQLRAKYKQSVLTHQQKRARQNAINQQQQQQQQPPSPQPHSASTGNLHQSHRHNHPTQPQQQQRIPPIHNNNLMLPQQHGGTLGMNHAMNPYVAGANMATNPYAVGTGLNNANNMLSQHQQYGNQTAYHHQGQYGNNNNFMQR